MLSLILAITLGTTPEVLGEPKVMNLNRLDGTHVLCLARQVIDGPSNRVGKWVYSGRYVPPAPPTNDHLGVGAILNRIRAAAGHRVLVFDQNLANWASQNNVAQNARGMGHHVNPGAAQNSGWNYANAEHVMNGWMNSPGHRQNIFANGTVYGVAYGPGPYWTLNIK